MKYPVGNSRDFSLLYMHLDLCKSNTCHAACEGAKHTCTGHCSVTDNGSTFSSLRPSCQLKGHCQVKVMYGHHGKGPVREYLNVDVSECGLRNKIHIKCYYFIKKLFLCIWIVHALGLFPTLTVKFK